MTIKPEARAAYFDKHPDQEVLASAFDEAFDITFGSHLYAQAAWFCAPKIIVSERFGLVREVLALYSPHNKADARVLTALENISRLPEFRHRIDKVVAFVVYEGDDNAIQSLCADNSDWILIPISARELKDPRRGAFFIRHRMAERIGQFDLFGMSSPIKQDKYFYGREKIVQEIVLRSFAKKEHSGLFGLRKTGKTSVLFAVQRRMNDKNALCEYIDCQSPGIYGSRWWAVVDEICDRLEKSAGLPASDRATGEAAAVNRLSRAVREIQDRQVFQHIALLFDEIEFVTPGISNNLGKHWDIDYLPFWQAIRSISQETGGYLTFVVAGVNPSGVEQSHFGEIPNPIFQLAVPFYLDPLDRAGVREMVRTIGKYSGVEFDEECHEFLRYRYGGHPYLIRLACSEVLRAVEDFPVDRRLNVGTRDFDASQGRISDRISQPIRDILLSLVWWYPDEYDLLKVLAEGDAEFVSEFLKSEPDRATHFAKYGLVEEKTGLFAIQDLRSFLETSGGEYKKALSPFRRGDLPLDVLPQRPDLFDLSLLFESRIEIEQALRTLLIMVLSYRFAFDETKVSKAIIDGLPRSQGGSDHSQLFIGRSPSDAVTELFLSQLKPIYLSMWENFAPYFGKNSSRFEMNLDTINIARRYEAHTKPLTKDDREHFLNSYAWLRSSLSKVPGLFVRAE